MENEESSAALFQSLLRISLVVVLNWAAAYARTWVSDNRTKVLIRKELAAQPKAFTNGEIDAVVSRRMDKALEKIIAELKKPPQYNSRRETAEGRVPRSPADHA